MDATRMLIFLKCGPNPHNGFEERNSCPIPAQLVCAHAGVDPLPITFSGRISSTFKALEQRCSRTVRHISQHLFNWIGNFGELEFCDAFQPWQLLLIRSSIRHFLAKAKRQHLPQMSARKPGAEDRNSCLPAGFIRSGVTHSAGAFVMASEFSKRLLHQVM